MYSLKGFLIALLVFFLIVPYCTLLAEGNIPFYGQYISYADLDLLDFLISDQESVLDHFGEPVKSFVTGMKEVWIYYLYDIGDDLSCRNVLRCLEMHFDYKGYLIFYDFFY